MIQRFILSKIIKKYILIFHLIKFIISSDIQFLYNNCIKYIEQLDIECLKFEENTNGIFECINWDVNNILAFIDIPKECLNKEYNLDILAKNMSLPFKINSNIFIENEILNLSKKKEMKIILNKKEEIIKCIDIMSEYLQICSINKPDNKRKNDCKEWKKNQNAKEFKFCIYLLEEFHHFIEPKSKNKKIRKNITLDNIGINDIQFIFQGNINNILINLSEDIFYEKYDLNFPTEKSGNDNDKGEPEANSTKDCIEYGLNPLNEDLIICNKYE